jgi:hypothetical protein
MASGSGLIATNPMPPWLFWIVATLLWLVAWIGIASRYTARKRDDALVDTLSALLKAFVAATCLVLFGALPRGKDAWMLVLWLHHAAFAMLFLFLIAAEYLQAEAWWRTRCGSPACDVAGTFRRLWILTELVPAPIAIGTLMTGLRLILEAPADNRPSKPWLCALIAGFSFFFWDGILGYQPIVRELRRHWAEAGQHSIPTVAAFKASKMGRRSAQLFAHFLSYPFVFMLGLLKPEFDNPLTGAVAGIEQLLSRAAPGWAEVLAASSIWLATGLTLACLRWLLRGFHVAP